MDGRYILLPKMLLICKMYCHRTESHSQIISQTDFFNFLHFLQPFALLTFTVYTTFFPNSNIDLILWYKGFLSVSESNIVVGPQVQEVRR